MEKRILITGALIILTAAFIFVLAVRGDRTDWLDRIESVTIYSIDAKSAANYDPEKLSMIESFTIDSPEDYFSMIRYKDEDVIWKGDRFGVVYLKDKSEIKIRVSSYGDFFSIIGKDGYYIYKKY